MTTATSSEDPPPGIWTWIETVERFCTHTIDSGVDRFRVEQFRVWLGHINPSRVPYASNMLQVYLERQRTAPEDLRHHIHAREYGRNAYWEIDFRYLPVMKYDTGDATARLVRDYARSRGVALNDPRALNIITRITNMATNNIQSLFEVMDMLLSEMGESE